MGNLLEAAERGNSKLVKKFLREGVDIQQRDLVAPPPPIARSNFTYHSLELLHFIKQVTRVI